MFGIISIVRFLYLIDHAARMLRPSSIVRQMGQDGISLIESIYPRPTIASPAIVSSPSHALPDRTVAHACNSGVVLAVDLAGLVARARRAGGMIRSDYNGNGQGRKGQDQRRQGRLSGPARIDPRQTEKGLQLKARLRRPGLSFSP